MEHEFLFVHSIGKFMIPTGSYFQRGRAQPPTSYDFPMVSLSLWKKTPGQYPSHLPPKSAMPCLDWTVRSYRSAGVLDQDFLGI